MTQRHEAPAAEEPAAPPSEDDLADIATGLHTLLQLAEETVATAESLTGGMVAEVLTDAPGASDTFRGGVVAYATELKVSLLGVTEECVDKHGVVSRECAAAMAEGARRLTGATYAVSTTGVAGPAPQEDKPVGTVFVGVCGPEGVEVDELLLPGERDEVRRRATGAALSALSARVAVRGGEETAVG
jgi:nicotinamide-nucleotide amidase